MDARNFFNPRGTTFPSVRLNQFGGSFGGPVVLPKLYNGKDKTFFFVDYEGYRRESQSLLGNVPHIKMRSGDFSETGRSMIHYHARKSRGIGISARRRSPIIRFRSSRWDPISAKMINAYPIPTSPGRFNNYFANRVQNQRWDQGDIRVDHQLSAKDNFFARFHSKHGDPRSQHLSATTIPGSRSR